MEGNPINPERTPRDGKDFYPGGDNLSRQFAVLLILGILLVLGFYPQPLDSSVGFLVGSLLCVGAAASIAKPSQDKGMPLGWQFLAFLLLGWIATCYSPYWMRSYSKWTEMLTGFLAFYLTWRSIRSVVVLRRLLYGIAGIAIGVSLYSIVLQWNHSPQRLAKLLMEFPSSTPEFLEDQLYTLATGRMRGSFGNPNHLAGFLVACSTPLLLLILRGKNFKERLLGIAGFSPVFWVILQTESRSGLLTLLLSLIILILGAFSEFRKNIFHWKLSPPKILALLLIFIMICFAFAESGLLTRVATIKTRMEYYGIAMKLIGEAPLFGRGLDSFALYYPQYHQLGRGEAQYVHNWPLEVWVEMGLAGLLLFAWWIGSIYQLFNRQLNIAQDRGEETVLLLLMSSVSAILLQSLFDFNNNLPTVFIYFCFFLGCLAGRTSDRVEQVDSRRTFWAKAGVRVMLGVFLTVFWGLGLALPYYADSQYEIGIAWIQSKEDPLVATQYLSFASRINPWNSDYQNSLGNHYLRLGQPQKALDYFQRAVALSPLKPRNHYDLYRDLLVVGDREKALNELRIAHRLHPTDDEYLLKLAEEYAKSGDRDRANEYYLETIKTLENATRANPNKAEYHRRLANVLEILGKTEEAKQHRRTAKKIMNELLNSLGITSPGAFLLSS